MKTKTGERPRPKEEQSHQEKQEKLRQDITEYLESKILYNYTTENIRRILKAAEESDKLTTVFKKEVPFSQDTMELYRKLINEIDNLKEIVTTESKTQLQEKHNIHQLKEQEGFSALLEEMVNQQIEKIQKEVKEFFTEKRLKLTRGEKQEKNDEARKLEEKMKREEGDRALSDGLVELKAPYDKFTKDCENIFLKNENLEKLFWVDVGGVIEEKNGENIEIMRWISLEGPTSMLRKKLDAVKQAKNAIVNFSLLNRFLGTRITVREAKIENKTKKEVEKIIKDEFDEIKKQFSKLETDIKTVNEEREKIRKTLMEKQTYALRDVQNIYTEIEENRHRFSYHKDFNLKLIFEDMFKREDGKFIQTKFREGVEYQKKHIKNKAEYFKKILDEVDQKMKTEEKKLAEFKREIQEFAI